MKTFLSILFLITTSSGFSAVIGPGDFSAGATLINFDNLAGGTNLNSGEIVTTQYAPVGATFVNPDHASRANANIAALFGGQSDPNVLFIQQHDGIPLGRPQQIFFSAPTPRVGAFFATSRNSTITLSAFSPGGVLLESVTLTGASAGPEFLTGFIGLEEAGGIGRVELFSKATFQSGENFNFFIDDVRFEPALVPEPGTLALFGLGLVGVILRRNRATR